MTSGSRQRTRRQQALQAQGAAHPHAPAVADPLFRDSAFFDPNDLVQVKYEMLRQVSHAGATKTEAAALFGLSRPAFYQAEAALARAGLAGLLPRPRGPKGAHKLTPEVMAFIDQHRAGDGQLHARALARRIETQLGVVVHPRSIERAVARPKQR